MKRIYLVLLISFLLSACQPAQPTEPAPNPSPTIFLPSASPTNPIAPPPETIVAPTLALTPTATITDTRLPAERWREWPIIPSVTPRAIEIYRSGLAMGLDPHAFSKVGDCQSVKAAFMGYFDIPERFSLGDNYAYLQQTIDNFAGHFNTDGQAVRGGFNAAAVLSPLWADPKACLPGENPLECELRITRPIIVIVSLEVWWDGRTPAQYETLMRRILDTIIAHGAVPILATKADNVEGDNSLNLTTAKLALEYDLPLWNFWASVQSLPAHGMDMQRNDGFHISTDAWSTRSFTGLEALDSIWRGLLGAVPSSSATQAILLTATPGAIPITANNRPPTPTPTQGATPVGGSNRIVFGLAKRQDEVYQYMGVFLLDPQTHQNSQIFGQGVHLQSISPDGQYLLVSDGSALYRTNVDGAFPLQITDQLFPFGDIDALWLSNEQIVAVVAASDSTHLALFTSNGVLKSDLPVPSESPVELYTSSDESHIYWEAGTCTSPGTCQLTGLWVTNPDGSSQQVLTGMSDPLLAPVGSQLVSTLFSSTSQNELTFTSPDGGNGRFFPLPAGLLVDYAWSPDGSNLAVVVANRSDYSGKVLSNRNFVIDPATRSVREFTQNTLLNPHVLWSPDGTTLFWVGTLPHDTGFMIGGSLINLRNQQITILDDAIGQFSQDYLTIANAYWLPLP